jgi:hypothetical protein
MTKNLTKKAGAVDPFAARTRAERQAVRSSSKFSISRSASSMSRSSSTRSISTDRSVA